MSRGLFHDIAQFVIGLSLIAGAFLFFYSLYFSGQHVEPSMRESLLQTNGGVIGILGTVAGFYFGTSLSSMRKDINKTGDPNA